MAYGLDVGLLNRLDRLIGRYSLHGGVGAQPVCLDEMMEAFWMGYTPLQKDVQALTVRWEKYQRRFVGIAYDVGLREPEESARKRYASAYEFAHVFC